MQASVVPDSQWARLRNWHRLNGRHRLPWRASKDPWPVFMAEFLLARTRAAAVEKVFPQIRVRFPCPEDVLSGDSDWRDITSSLGLISRADLFVEACRAIVSRFNGEVPRERQDLLALPGVGHYIAATVRNFAWNIPEVIVDTNTIRLANRVSGMMVDKSHHRNRLVRSQVALLGRNPRGQSPARNYALLDLAALICTPTRPDCCNCPINRCCVIGSRKTRSEN